MASERDEPLKDPPVRVRVAKRRAEAARDDLDLYVRELDRRGRKVIEVAHRVRHHPASAVVLGAAVVATKVADATVFAFRFGTAFVAELARQAFSSRVESGR